VRAARIDANQPEIVDALRKIGARVKPTHGVGGGYPDLTVGYRGRTILMEVKMPGEGLNKEQAQFFAEWNGGPLFIVRTKEEAVLAAVGEEAMA
jgi:hypothetical protein